MIDLRDAVLLHLTPMDLEVIENLTGVSIKQFLDTLDKQMEMLALQADKRQSEVTIKRLIKEIQELKSENERLRKEIEKYEALHGHTEA